MIYRLLYVSSVATAQLSQALEDILRQSVGNNGRDSVTGLLICDGLEFAQVLEGDERIVERCFDRICADRRNTDIAVHARGAVEGRAFPRWSMCGLYLSAVDDQLLSPGDIELRLRDLSAGALLQHLEGLSRRHGAALDAQHDRLLTGSRAM